MTETKTCIEYVGGGWHRTGVKCGKPAGFGRDGNYCTKHAMNNPAGDEPVVATFWRVGNKNIIEEVPAIKRTAKTFTDKNGSVRRLDTYSKEFFETREECVEYVRGKLESNVASAEANLVRSKEWLADFYEREGRS